MNEETLEWIEYRLKQIQYLLFGIFVAVGLYVIMIMLSSRDTLINTCGLGVFVIGVVVFFWYVLNAVRSPEK